MILDKVRLSVKKTYTPDSFNKKILFIKLIFGFLFLLVFVRSLELQIFKTRELDQIAIKQYQRFKKLQTQRGSIYDTNGKILASSIPYYSVFILNKQIEDQALTIEKLAALLPESKEKIAAKIYSNKKFVWLKKLFDFELKTKIDNLELAGIHVVQDFRRYYPMENLAAHVLGFVGYDSQGLEGIEYKYNKHLLKSKNTVNKKLERGKIFEGGNIFLTIDENIQYFLEKELKKYAEKLDASHVQAIVMETKTASILGMANYPDYNPNNFLDYSSNNYLNRSVSAAYEPGSTFKIITIASALSEKVINTNQKIYCEDGSYFIGGSIIKDTQPYSYLTPQAILQKSSNICILKIGRLLSNKKFYQYIRKFGFGQKTNIELPGEIRGVVHDYKKWTSLDSATISYGHSILVTPIQLISAINTIANDGVFIEPRIIKSAQDALGREIKILDSKKHRVVNRAVARKIRQMLISVTQKGGTGYLANISGINIAGKTGTARKYSKELKGYSKENHILSFAAMLPAEEPQLTILVILDDPKKSKKTSYSAAPLFKKIAKSAILYYGISYDNQKKWSSQKNKEISSISDLK